MQEHLGLLLELVGILGGQVAGGVALRALLLYLGVLQKVLLQAVGDVLSLWNYPHSGGQVLQNLGHEQRIMSTAQDEGVNLRVLAHDFVDTLLDEIVGTRGVGLIVFH